MKVDKKFFVLLAVILIFQFSYFGLKYFAVADDNNQIGVFHLKSDNIYENVIQKYKSYNVRPLAFFTEAYVFSWFSDNMYALLLIMVIMHIFNIFFMYKICEKIGIKLNALFLVTVAVAPFLIEALYWISASDRIVFSLFLCLASIYLLLLSFEEENSAKKLTKFMSAIILNLLCVGYYEQTVAFNLFFFAFVLICLKKYKYMFIPITSTAWIGAYYVYFMVNGEMQARGTLNLGGIFGNLISSFNMVNYNLKLAVKNFFVSFKNGINEVTMHIATIFLLALIVYFIYHIYKTKIVNNVDKTAWKKLLLGITLFVAPILPFIILESGYIAMRNMYMLTFGLVIIGELIFDLIVGRIKNEKTQNIISTTVIGIVLILGVIANIDGVNNYKKVNDLDNKVTAQMVKKLPAEAFESDKSISINYDEEALAEYKNLSNFVESTLEADWIMLGKLQVIRENTDVPKVYINENRESADYVLDFDNEMNLISVTSKYWQCTVSNYIIQINLKRRNVYGTF